MPGQGAGHRCVSMVVVLSLASLAFSNKGCLGAKPDNEVLDTSMSVLLCGCSEDDLSLVRRGRGGGSRACGKEKGQELW